MIRAFYRGIVASWVLLGAGAGLVQAAAWADRMFPENRHDFGPVPRGAKVKHDFLLVNHLSEPVTIVGLRPSCGCTSGRASASVVAPGQTAVIEAQMDTRNFVGAKSTVLYVSLMTAGGKEAETGLGVNSTILSDIVLNPGSIDFGAVAHGQSPSQVLTIDRINLEGWRVHRMVSSSRVLSAQLVETSRKGGAVSYRMTVNVKPDAPPGPIRDEIRILSNDPETPSIPVMVTAWIRGELTAAPSILAMGQVNSAAGVQGRFVIRGAHPFAVQAIEGNGDGFSASAPQNARQAVHVVTITYKPEEGTTRGDLRRAFRVHTDLPGEPPLDLTATLHVDP
jgi:Protein of unknown function (DUF1573)